MANLIIKENNVIPHGILESTIKVTNWRAVGNPDPAHLYLVLANFETYLIDDLHMGKFLEIVRLNLDLQVKGELVSISAACPKCEGTGITDWVSKIVDRPPRKIRLINGNNFKRDTSGKLYKTSNRHMPILNVTRIRKSFVCYYSTVVVPEAMEHCEFCKGNGIFYFSKAAKKGIIEETSYERW